MASTTGLRVEAERTTDQMIAEQPMKIGDAASMMRRRASPNERPYDHAVKKYNNALVDEWYEKVLMKIADADGNVPAGRVGSCLGYFLMGKKIKALRSFLPDADDPKGDESTTLGPTLPRIDPKAVDFWVEKLGSTPVRGLCTLGPSVVNAAWTMIKMAIFRYSVRLKWDAIYSQTDDPREWDRLCNDHHELWSSSTDQLPKGLSRERLVDIERKVKAILQTQIPRPPLPPPAERVSAREVTSAMKVRPKPNEPPYEREVMEHNNDLVEDWHARVLSQVADAEGKVLSERVPTCFGWFVQGLEIAQHQKYREYLWPKQTQEAIDLWMRLLEESDVSRLAELGVDVVGAGWSTIITTLRYEYADRKWEAVYSKSTDPRQWDWLGNENLDVMNGVVMPFGLARDRMEVVEEKVKVLMRYPIGPT